MTEADRITVVGNLIILDELPMTGATAEALGRTWLAENYERLPLCVLYRDVEGKRQFALVEEEPPMSRDEFERRLNEARGAAS